MAALRNARHERFALAVADGRSAGEAYVAAGYSCGPQKARGHGHRLRTREDVQNRIADLLHQQERIAEKGVERAIECTGITKSRVAAELARIAFGEVGGTGAAAIKVSDKRAALMDLARLFGWIIDKQEAGPPGAFYAMSDAELEQRLVDRLSGNGIDEKRARALLRARVVEGRR